MRKSLEVVQEVQGSELHLKFIGNIDESVAFPEFDQAFSKIHFDLEKVGAINSVGIKNWLMWLERLKGNAFHFSNCPVSFMMQLNMVDGFVPKASEIHSFFVPFYCETCDKEFRNLMKSSDVLFDGSQLSFPGGEPSCDKGCELELDVNENKYFRFLLEKRKSAA